jgi:hypothetical protein
MHDDGRGGYNAGGGYLGVRAEGAGEEKDKTAGPTDVGLHAVIVSEMRAHRDAENGAGCLNVVGKAAACSRARLSKSSEINAPISEP